MRPETLQDLAARLHEYGERPAVGFRSSYGTRWWSYARLEREARRVASVLRGLGVEPGQRMLLWAQNSPEWVAAALGASLRGVVVVPVDADASPEHARRLADAARPALVVHGPDQDVSRLPARSLPLFAVLTHPPGSPGEQDRVPAAPDQPAFVLFTSGSTRSPRGVVLSHRNLLTQAEAFARWERVTRARALRLLVLSPLSHAQGLVIGIVVPLRLGLSVLYSAAVDPAHVIRTIRQNRVNLLLAVPRVQHLLAQALQAAPAGGSGRTLGERARSLRWFPLRRHVLFLGTHAQLGYSFWVLLVGGAPLDPSDERFWYECGYVLVQGYGMTETSAVISIKVNGPFAARLGSVGRPLPAQQVRLADDGELWVRGPNVALQVFGDDAADPIRSADGFLPTGDLAWRDRHGFLRLRGRKKHVLVGGDGRNVHPEDVERVLRACDGVRDAVVLELPGSAQPEVHAVLLLGPGVSAPRVVADANAGLQTHQRVRSWSVWPAGDFPRTSLLKVRRAEVAEVAGSLGARDAAIGQDRPAAPSLADVRAEGDRRRRLVLLADLLGESDEEAGPGRPDAAMEELGLSSLDVVELLLLLERRRSRPLDGLAVTPRTRVSELAGMVRTGGPARRGRLPVAQPRWSGALPGQLVRRVTQPLLIGAWARCSARVDVEWVPAGARVSGPCILAASPHHHWLDAFAVQAALGGRWRTVTVTNRDFSEYFAADAGVPLATRLGVGLAYHLLWPLVFGFVIVPNAGDTRAGLFELGRAIDRGLSPLAFPKGLAPPGEDNLRHEPGIALMAIQTGLPVVPVWIEGNDGLGLWPGRSRPAVTVRVGAPIDVSPTAAVTDVVERLEAAFARLAATVRAGG